MRFITSDEILTDEKYLELSAPEMVKLQKLVALFAKEDKEELPLSFIQENLNINEDFMEKVKFCVYFGKVVYFKKYFSWFKGNKKAVAKARTKVVKVEKITAKVEKEAITNAIDFDKIKDMFNERFQGFSTPQIDELNNHKKIAMEDLYKVAIKKIGREDLDIYGFYDIYFDLIIDSDEKTNLIKGWPNNRTDTKWFYPGITTFATEKWFNAAYNATKEN